MDTDDLEPPRPILKPLDMQQMSVEELRAYIASLDAEKERAKLMIAKKQDHLNAAAGLFRTAQ